MRRRAFLQTLGACAAFYGCGGSSSDPPASTTSPSFVPPVVARSDGRAAFAFDAEGNRYEARDNSLIRFDAAGSQVWSVPGPVRPVALGVDPSGRIWVLERGPGQLRLFDGQGNPLGIFGSFRAPQDLAVSSDRLYVSEAVGRRVSVLDLNGTAQSAITHTDLELPRGLALNSSGELHVVSAARGRVLIFGPDGGLRGSYGQGLFGQPSGVAVRPGDGLISVSDPVRKKVQLLSGSLSSVGSLDADPARSLRYQPDGNLALTAPGPFETAAELLPYASIFLLTSYLFPLGQLLPADSWPDLVAVLGQLFGGNGSTLFNLPNLPLLPTRTAATVRLIQALTGAAPPTDLLGLVGEVRLWPGPNRPSNWLACDGTVLPVAGNEELAGALGARFGGDGSSTFGLPNLPNYAPDVGYIICAEGVVADPSYVPDAYLGTFTYYAGPTSFQNYARLDQDQQVFLTAPDNQQLVSLVGAQYGFQDGSPQRFGLPWLDPLAPGVVALMPLAGVFPPLQQ